VGPEEVHQRLFGVPGPGVDLLRGALLYDTVLRHRAYRVLEVGTGRAKSTSYLCAAAEELGGHARVDTIDSILNTWSDPSAAEVLELMEGSARVTQIKRHACASWDLIDCHTRGTTYDLVFMDGPKSLASFLACALVARELVAPGGHMVIDDLNWTYANHASVSIHFGVDIGRMSEREKATPHIGFALAFLFRDGAFQGIQTGTTMGVFRRLR
jgi:predicted O-methyltransferase YrrM